MKTKERIFQTVLFEIIAVLLSLGLVKILAFFGLENNETTNDSHLLLMFLSMSLIAMMWAFIYNLGFDKIFTGEKIHRSFWVRGLHIVGFEGGLLCFTLPIVMWVMGIGIWQAFMLDISLTLMILIYGFIFYWLYDNIRAKFVKS